MSQTTVSSLSELEDTLDLGIPVLTAFSLSRTECPPPWWPSDRSNQDIGSPAPKAPKPPAGLVGRPLSLGSRDATHVLGAGPQNAVL